MQQWKSCSLQRNAIPPNANGVTYLSNGSATNAVFRYSSGSPSYAGGASKIADMLDQSNHSIPAVILENPSESTVVIRRKLTRPKVCETGPNTPPIKEEPFGRATNMRMTSFMENSDLKSIKASSATLPHYLTQPPIQLPYPHCSTMPLPQHGSNGHVPATLEGGNSCNIYPRQHSTIPTHHNGVKLFNSPQNHYLKKIHPEVGVKSNEAIYIGINRRCSENFRYHT